ncbi:LCP family protein [Desulfotomaculum sp. 1211_IL3151]|uniref:LCP family protein n=1 Tax=Desulfotomaculum sp. 1211_IL3151 TaxID=3084055 RepID=UPI002FD94DB5
MERRRKRKVRVIPLIIFCTFFALVVGTGYVLANQFLFSGAGPSLSALTLGETEDEDVLKNRMNFLLLGVDAREGETNTRTDSLILVSVDKDKNRIAMISLPRDTRVKIPGHGQDKINAANVFGGPELVMETVSNLTGVKIDHYLTTNVRGFRDIVDALGGVTIDVEKRMYHYDPYDEPDLQKIDLQPGLQELNGDKALQYVRFRSDALGDVSRTERQQKFLKALAQEMMQTSTITKLPKLVPTINKYLDTNLGLAQMVTLAKAAKNLSSVEIVTQTMPGKFLDMNGVSYWSVDPKQAKMVAESLIQEGKPYDVVLGEETVNTQVNTQTIAKEEPKPKTKANESVNPILPTNDAQDSSKKDKETPVTDTANQEKPSKSTNPEKKDNNVEIIVDDGKGSGAAQQNNPSTGDNTNDEASSWLPSTEM